MKTRTTAEALGALLLADREGELWFLGVGKGAHSLL